MNRLARSFAVILLAAGSAIAATDLTVFVKNSSGSPITRAAVLAVHFNGTSPDSAVSRMAFTDATGAASFTSGGGNALVDTDYYDVFAASQGFVPALYDQSFNPSHLGVVATGGVLPNGLITIDSTGVSGLGEIDVDVQNASANGWVVGEIRKASDQSLLGRGFTYVDGSGLADATHGGGPILIPNVTYMSTSAYIVYGQDAGRNVFFTFPGQETLAAWRPKIHYTSGSPFPPDNNMLNFNGGLHVQQTQNVGGQNAGSGAVGVVGTVTDTTTAATPIPSIGLSFYFASNDPYCGFNGNCWQQVWSQSDQNGSFQLTGLQPNTTYYGSILGSCFNGKCYLGYTSPAGINSQPAPGTPLGSNDFYYTGTQLFPQIKLDQAVGGGGSIKVYVKDNQGVALPQSSVSAWSDWANWGTSPNCATTKSNPGYSQFNGQATTGYVLVTGLLSGNYNLQAYTQFDSQGGTQYNAGPDGQFGNQSGCTTNGSGADDLRVTIDTTTPNADVYVYNSNGALVFNGSSLTITVSISTRSSGLVYGTLTFPGPVDLSNDPINITLQPQQCCNGAGYAVVTNAVGSTTGPVVNYAIHVASGQSYWLNVTANYWGVVQSGGQNQINLGSTDTVIHDLIFAPAGRLIGKMFKPDGSLFVPSFGNSSSNSGSVNANGGNSWGYTQIGQDGSYSLGGLLPGAFSIGAQGWGNFPYTSPTPLPKVSVTANKDAYFDVNLVDAVGVKMNIDTTTLPAIPFLPNPPCQGDECIPENWKVISLPHGAILDTALLVAKMTGIDEHAGEFKYSTNGQQCNGDNLGHPGFCVNRLASPGRYDFLLARAGSFDSQGILNPPTRPYLVILNSTQSVAINANAATSNTVAFGSTIAVVPLNLTPSPSLVGAGQSWIKGTVTAQNIFRQQDFQALGGDFNKFLTFLPILALYDSSGSLKATGMTVPLPTAEAPLDAQLNTAVANGDWTSFQTLLQSFYPMGYEIRGVLPGVYTAVLTTPNYPPFQTSVTLTAGATSTLDVDLDATVGSGGTLAGVVTDTNTVVVSTAQITISADNYPARTITSDASGTYSRPGLPAGTYTINVVASGFSQTRITINVSGTGVTAQNVRLQRAGASIAGYVEDAVTHARLSGAHVLAFDDSSSLEDPPVYRIDTDSSGHYSIDGLIASTDAFKVSVWATKINVPDPTDPTRNYLSYYYAVTRETTTEAGGSIALDFTGQNGLFLKPLDIQVYAKRTTTGFRFQILNPGAFNNGDAWIGDSPFVMAASTEVGSLAQEILGATGKIIQIDVPTSMLDAQVNHVLHVEATVHNFTTGRDDVYKKEVSFNTSGVGNATQNLDIAILGDDSDSSQFQGHANSDAVLDPDGQNLTGVHFPAGATIAISTVPDASSIPHITFSAVDVAGSTQADTVGADAFASGVYNIAITSANFTGRGFTLTLAYDKNSTSLTDLAIYHFNEATQQWEPVPGVQTIDPVKGTITIRILSLATLSSLRANSLMAAQYNGKSYHPNSRYYQALARGLIPDDSGLFGILKPSLAGGNFAGTTFKVFNFPNPFNLDTKTVPIVNGNGVASVTTKGTVIKYELPSGRDGHVVVRIYTLAGELVKEIDQGQETGGKYYYTAWDGTNRRGSNVANGVYYGVISAPGTKIKDATFKLAVIK